MPKTYQVTAEQGAEVARARKKTKDKQTDQRLHAVQLRGEGKKNEEIAERLETSTDMVSRWVSQYMKGGIEALQPKKRGGNHRNMSIEAERELIARFEEQAKAGQVVEVSEIKRAYEGMLGRKISSGQIYYVLARHKWRKIKPRSQHPKKANPEAIEASKKLTVRSAN
jgi:transposase